MPSDALNHLVFVDFENVPNVDLNLVMGKPVHVTLLIGQHQKKLELGLVQQIVRLAPQVELVEVGASGHNALDLTLAYHLGQAVQRTPGAQFCIVSKDKDFEPLIRHLRGRKVEVVRCESFEAVPFLAPAKKPAVLVNKPLVDRRGKVIARLKNPENLARPSSRKALLAHIKAALGKEGSDPKVESLLGELLGEKVLTIDPKGKVSYSA